MYTQDGTKFEPEDDHEVVCEAHGVKTTWGALDPHQRMAVENGIDTVSDLPCILTKRV
jgi:hypothetical protein